MNRDYNILLSLILLLQISCATVENIELKEQFTVWMNRHEKQYHSGQEWNARYLIFSQNLELINEMNLNKSGGDDVVFEINQFGDMTQEEFKHQILMADQEPPVIPKIFQASRYLKWEKIKKPSQFDWRKKGVVTPVKNQGSAGSCWAFSATGNIEALYNINYGREVRVSEEQIIDCNGKTDPIAGKACCGVFGGWPYLAFEYIIEAGGIDPERDYPYCVGGGTYETSCFPCDPPGFDESLCGQGVVYCDDKRWPCRTIRNENAIKIADWKAIGSDEEEIADQLIQYGPLSIGLNATMLQFYKKGIFDPHLCNSNHLNHAVLLVGYGEGSIGNINNNEKDKPYWIVKNSWGEKWGEEGFFRIVKGQGKCGVNKVAATAILE